MYKKYSWSELTKSKTDIKDGIYCGFYNGENCLIRIINLKPCSVQFADNSSIFDERGIMLSSVEILINQK